MSYASGLMMGAAIIQGLGQLFGGAAPQGMGGMGRKMGVGGGSKGGFPFQMPEFPLQGLSAAFPQGEEPRATLFLLVSALPGRRRYRVTGMTVKQARMLEETLGRLSYMKEVRGNENTGSLLLVYEEGAEKKVDDLAKALEKNFFGGALSGEAGSLPPGPSEAHAGSVTRSIRGTARDLSAWIKYNTNGWFDASSLAAVVLFFQGVKKMLSAQQFPSGSQMFWWAVSLMRGWRTV